MYSPDDPTRSTRPPSPAPVSRLVVAAAIVDSLSAPTHLLCAARSYPATYAGQYELPGGKVEPGETPQAALTRELTEELHLAVHLGDELHPVAPHLVPAPDPSHIFPGDDAAAWPVLGGYRMRVWLAEPADPTHSPRRTRVHSALRWYRLEDVEALPWLSADAPILSALLALTAGTDRARDEAIEAPASASLPGRAGRARPHGR